MRKRLKWMIISTCLIWLVGCAPLAEVVSVTATRPAATKTPVMTATVVPTNNTPAPLPTLERQSNLTTTPTPFDTPVSRIRAASAAPSGDKVAFTRETGYGETAEPGLYVVDNKTGEVIQISPLDRAGMGGSGLYWRPFWSADSSQVLLYAGPDEGRTAVSPEAGYVWAAADGSFSHFLPISQFLAQYNEPLTDPEAHHCTGAPVNLFDTNLLVQLVGECPPSGMGLPETWRVVAYYLRPETGDIDRVEVLPVTNVVDLVDWDVPGESLLALQGEDVISVPLPDTNQ